DDDGVVADLVEPGFDGLQDALADDADFRAGLKLLDLIPRVVGGERRGSCEKQKKTRHVRSLSGGGDAENGHGLNRGALRVCGEGRPRRGGRARWLKWRFGRRRGRGGRAPQNRTRRPNRRYWQGSTAASPPGRSDDWFAGRRWRRRPGRRRRGRTGGRRGAEAGPAGGRKTGARRGRA